MAYETVGDRLLARLADHVDYLFANAGTDFPSLIEAVARAETTNAAAPKAIAVPHENLAVAMALGHTMVSGRAQAVMVHVGVGTANAICGLLNASRERLPLLLAAGRTPLLEAGAEGARSRYIHWAQEMYDQAGMLREAVKWDYELGRPEQLETVLDRAFAIATSEPRGPVYLSLPREVLAAPAAATATTATTLPAAQAPAATASAIDAAAAILAEAQRPLIVTASAGRDPAAVEHLARLAERFALPVVSFFPRQLCLPSDHPMHLGYEPGPLLAEADAVLVLECDVPWIPSLQGPPQGARVIQLGVDPLFADYPLRGFPAELAITAQPAAALEALGEALAARLVGAGEAVAERRQRLAQARQELEAGWLETRERLAGATPIHPVWLSHCLDQVIDDEAIVVNEMALALAHITRRRPGSYFGPSPAGGLGWGLGAALGAKLAAPERFVVAAVGDGSYMFGNPTPAHFVSRAHDLPVLFIVANNSGWGAVSAATRAMYPDGEALKRNRMPLATLEPTVAFEHVVEASGGWGERVEDPAALPEALQRAVRVVREEGRQALLNVITQDR